MLNLSSSRLISYFFDVKLIPILILFVGILLLVVGYFVLPLEERMWRPFCITTGQALLAGGVFAVILKTFQYIGIFKQEIQEVIYGSQFLEKLGEVRLREIWASVSAALCNKRFPEISNKVNEAILNQYMPLSDKCYYKKHHVTLDIEWKDKSKSIIQLSSYMEAEIIPYMKEELVNYPFSFYGLDPDPDSDDEFKLLDLRINGEDKSDQSEKQYEEDSLGRRVVTENYDLPLQGSSKYDVKRRYIRLLNIKEDPVSTFSLIYMCMTTSIVIRNKADGLFINFQDIGTIEKFRDVSPAVVENGIIKHLYKSYDDLMFPQQGYILSFHMT